MPKGISFDDTSLGDLLVFLLTYSDDWIKRTVEKAEVISEKEYNHRASIFLNISNSRLTDVISFMNQCEGYWNGLNHHKLAAACASLKSRLKQEVHNLGATNRQLHLRIPIFRNPKYPLIDFDIKGEGFASILEVLNRKAGIASSIKLHDLTLKLLAGNDFFEANKEIVSDLLGCYPRHIETRMKRSRRLPKILIAELRGYMAAKEIELIEHLMEANVKQISAIKKKSEHLISYLADHLGQANISIWTTPLLLIRDDYKSYYEPQKGIEAWLCGFLSRCDKYLDCINRILHKDDRTREMLLVILNDIAHNYILFIKAKIQLESPLFVKLSSKKVYHPYNHPYDAVLTLGAAYQRVRQLASTKGSSILTKISTLPGIGLVTTLYFYIVRAYFSFDLSLLGHAESYHFEVATKDPEIDVQTYSVQYQEGRELRAGRLEEHFGVNVIAHSYLHICTTKQAFFSKKGKPLETGGFRLIVWPYIRKLPILLFATVTLIETLGLYLLKFDNSLYKPNNIIGIAIISMVATFTIRYTPGNIAACMVRRWKRIITVGLLANVVGFCSQVILNDFASTDRSYIYDWMAISITALCAFFLYWVFHEFVCIRLIQIIKGFNYNPFRRPIWHKYLNLEI